MVNQKERDNKKARTIRFTGWKNSRGVRLLLFFLFVLLFYVSTAPKWIQETYDIELNAVSETAIQSPETIENTAATLRARADASEDVMPVYSVIPMRNEELLELLFSKLELVNADPQMGAEDKISIYKNEFPQIYKDFFDGLLRINRETYKDSLLKEVRLRLSENEYRIPEETYFKLPRLTLQELSEMEVVSKSIVAKLMNDRITDPQNARAKVPEMVNASQLASKNARETVQELTRFVLTPNRFYDEEATKEAKIKAEESMEPIFISKGDIIVDKGERITQEKYALLEELGLLRSKTSKWPQVGSAVVVFMFVFVLYMFIKQSELPIASNNAHLLMLLLIFALTTIGLIVVSLGVGEQYPYIGYLAPAAMGSMLIAILLGAKIAFIAAMILSTLSSIILNVRDDVLFDYRYGFVAAVVCFVSIFAIHRAGQRSSILKAGVLISVFGGLSSVALILIENAFAMKDLLYALGFSLSGGMVTAVLVIGLLPFFELAFGILSPLKLVELSSPNHPLLRKLLTETPGTYHHSVMVGNLSEAAAEAIGADGLLCRVGSFYHDIGKTKRPSYFIENQTNIENPHDYIAPSLSKSIIIAHARDGVEMLLAHKIPKQICDIAEQHHGTTLLQYFYHKAKKQLEESGETEKTIDEEQYRYPGPKAQTREAAIVGIADGLEASVRSLRNPTPEQIDSMVQKIIKSRLDDGQLGECDLTLKELNTVARSMKETLLGVFHSRIEYPEEMSAKAKIINDRKGEENRWD